MGSATVRIKSGKGTVRVYKLIRGQSSVYIGMVSEITGAQSFMFDWGNMVYIETIPAPNYNFGKICSYNVANLTGTCYTTIPSYFESSMFGDTFEIYFDSTYTPPPPPPTPPAEGCQKQWQTGNDACASVGKRCISSNCNGGCADMPAAAGDCGCKAVCTTSTSICGPGKHLGCGATGKCDCLAGDANDACSVPGSTAGCTPPAVTPPSDTGWDVVVTDNGNNITFKSCASSAGGYFYVLTPSSKTLGKVDTPKGSCRTDDINKTYLTETGTYIARVADYNNTTKVEKQFNYVSPSVPPTGTVPSTTPPTGTTPTTDKPKVVCDTSTHFDLSSIGIGCQKKTDVYIGVAAVAGLIYLTR